MNFLKSYIVAFGFTSLGCIGGAFFFSRRETHIEILSGEGSAQTIVDHNWGYVLTHDPSSLGENIDPTYKVCVLPQGTRIPQSLPMEQLRTAFRPLLEECIREETLK